MTYITKEDLIVLERVNNERRSIQERLVEKAKAVLDLEEELRKLDSGFWCIFACAELTPDGSAVAITFEWGAPYETYGMKTEEFPIDRFLDDKWATETRAAIDRHNAEKAAKESRIATLKGELAALEQSA